MSRNAVGASFLPEFCGSRMAFVVVLLAQLLAIALTLSTPGAGVSEFDRLALYSVMSLWIGLLCLAVLCLLRRHVQGLPDHLAAAACYATTLGVTLAVSEVAWQMTFGWLALSGSVGTNHAGFLLRCLGISAIAWALALRYFYVQQQWRRRVESEADARFAALQARIRPHFLFNCMNTIAGLTRQAPALAEQAVEDLSDLLRASLHSAGQPVTLAEEIALCRGYLRIEKHRLGNRLQVDWQLPEGSLEQKLPALTLQPLLENAVYHGIELLPEGGTVTIACSVTPLGTTITLSNPVMHGDAGATLRPGHNMAQENVAQRLAAFFGQNGLLRFHESPGQYSIEMLLPHESPDR
jgi:two-component system sensor histidine kinase AlgZ